ncbi:MAG: hypothetical protein R3F11_15770 [Verrucomicrobiales bacterium]
MERKDPETARSLWDGARGKRGPNSFASMLANAVASGVADPEELMPRYNLDPTPLDSEDWRHKTAPDRPAEWGPFASQAPPSGAFAELEKAWLEDISVFNPPKTPMIKGDSTRPPRPDRR